MITKLGYKELLDNLVLANVSVGHMILHMRVSDGVVIETENDITLAGATTEEVSVMVLNSTSESVTFTGVIPYNMYNGNIIAEVGLFSKTGVMFARKVLPEGERHLKTIDHQVEINWEITI